MQIITGKTGTLHVTPEMDRATHRATFGADEYVLSDGDIFKASIEASDTIRLAPGEGVMQGVRFCIPYGTYDDAIIDSGTTGYMRKDLIAAQYNKVGDIESVNHVVIKGEPVTSEPQLPEYTHASIIEGAIMSQMPLYEVLLDGVNIISVTSLFKTITSLDDVYRKNEVDAIKQTLQNNINTVQSAANTAQNTANQAATAATAAQSKADSAANLANVNKNDIAAMEQSLLAQIDAVNSSLSNQIGTINEIIKELQLQVNS